MGDTFCTTCGAGREPGSAFCIRCGAPYSDLPEQSRPAPAEPAPGGRRQLGPVLAVAAVCLLLLGGAYAFWRGQHDTSGQSSSDPSPARVTTPFVSTSPTTAPDTSSAPATDQPTSPSVESPSVESPSVESPSVESPSDESPSVGNDVVAVSDEAQDDPRAPAVVALLTRYFSDINNRDFADYVALHSAEVQADLDVDQLKDGYRSTFDSDARLAAITSAPDGRTSAVVLFQSQQDPGDSRDQQACTLWNLQLFLEPDDLGDGYVLGAPPPGYHARSSSC
jgi:hypothetical protein